MSNHPKVEWQKHEQGTLVFLVLLSLFGLIYVSSNFIFNILFAIIMTLSTYPFYEKLKNKYNLSNSKAAGISTLSVGLILVAPVSYIISILGIESLNVYNYLQGLFSKINFATKETTVDTLLTTIKLSENYVDTVRNVLLNHVDVQSLGKSLKDILLFLSQSAIGSVLGTIAFFIISLFTMFFLYRDGSKIANKMKEISPLHDYYDDVLMREMSRLSGILTLSILSISLIQGLSFAAVAFFLDLNWLFLGVAIALTSFIPIVGTMLVWLPVGSYLLLTGNSFAGIFVILWGALFIGLLVDNILRPFIVSYISGMFDNAKLSAEEEKNFNPLNHTLIVTMSTLGGVVKFGIVGLFLGPIIAGIAIAILEIYRLRVSGINEIEKTKKVNNLEYTEEEIQQIKTEEVDFSIFEKMRKEDLNLIEDLNIIEEFEKDLSKDLEDLDKDLEELDKYLDKDLEELDKDLEDLDKDLNKKD